MQKNRATGARMTWKPEVGSVTCWRVISVAMRPNSAIPALARRGRPVVAVAVEEARADHDVDAVASCERGEHRRQVLGAVLAVGVDLADELVAVADGVLVAASAAPRRSPS